MRLLSRIVFWEVAASAIIGSALFTFIVFMQRSARLFEFLVRNSGSSSSVGYLFALVLPQALPYSIPLGILTGTLIALSRMSSDGEITAMRAAGVSARKVAWPILTCAYCGFLVTAAASLWLTPWSVREGIRVANQLVAGQLTAEVQPRIFQEQFPDRVLYVSDVALGQTARWRRIFMADVTPIDKLPAGVAEGGDSPRVTIAPEAIAVPDVPLNRVQLALKQGRTYQAGKNPLVYQIVTFEQSDQVLPASRPPEVRLSRPTLETDTIPLYREAYQAGGEKLRKLEAQVELHQRLALPLACMLLAFVGIPLGITSRRAGKSSAIVLTVAIALFYYMGLISMISLARQETLPAALSVWLPNILLAVFGTILFVRLESPGDHDFMGRFIVALRSLLRPANRLARASESVEGWLPRTRFFLLPQVVDAYVLRSFLFYFILMLATFVMMVHVFTFFELLSDIIKHSIPFARVLTYHFFLTPRFISDFTPAAVLTAGLVVFGVLTKNNEITAFKACGVSVYRLTLPVLLAALAIGGGLFAFNHYWVPEADRIQDRIHAEIKGGPAQTFLNPNRRWISGVGNRIYYYKYFDQAQNVMGGVSVFEIDWERAQLKRHIFAERARWEPGLRAWVFQNGWSRTGRGLLQFDNFPNDLRSFSDLEEGPDYFVKEARQFRQMNFRELEGYIAELKQSGFETTPLQVQFHKKFAVPLFTLILAMVSIPFAFQTGNRGAMAGFGIAIVIYMTYWGIDRLFEQVGSLGQLPPTIAAWSPDAVFSLAGLYFMARIRT